MCVWLFVCRVVTSVVVPVCLVCACVLYFSVFPSCCQCVLSVWSATVAHCFCFAVSHQNSSLVCTLAHVAPHTLCQRPSVCLGVCRIIRSLCISGHSFVLSMSSVVYWIGDGHEKRVHIIDLSLAFLCAVGMLVELTHRQLRLPCR